MNLLSNIFNIDRIRIMEVNKKYMIIFVIVLILIILLLFIKKDFYYTNTISNVGDNTLIVVEKNMVNIVKSKDKIIIDDVENSYSINKIEILQDVCFIYIDLENNSLHSNMYKIYLGKESVLEYIIRILK